MALNNGVQTEDDFFTLQQKVANKREEYDDQTTSNSLDGGSDPITSLPSYLRASVAHAIATGDLSPLVSESDEPVGGALGAVAGAVAGARVGATFGVPGVIGGAIIGAATGYDWRYAADAVISGTSQLVNGGINLITFGATPDAFPVEDTIAALDDDLAKYYQDNEEAVDVGGFLASSLIPGTLAVKGLNWGSKVLEHSRLKI